MLYLPFNEFSWSFSSVQNTRPAVPMGTSITPGTAPTMGAWTQIISSANMTNDAYAISICFNNGSTSAVTRNYLVDIGVDTSGGTNYSVWIPYLMAGHSAVYNVGGGIFYNFPLYIPAGSSVAVRAMGNVTTVFSTYISVFGKPKRPDQIQVGTKVFSFGQTLATATGTSITLGTTAEGAWTQVGSALTQSCWWWQVGYTAVDTTFGGTAIHLDVGVGDATNKDTVLENVLVIPSATETIVTFYPFMACGIGAPGEIVYMRGQTSGAADTTPSVMCWGLG